MRALAVLLVATALLVGAYVFYLKKMPVTDEGTASTQAIALTGVRGDLLQIAQAERAFVSTNGNCAPLADLLSSGTLAMSRTERDGYTYLVECSGTQFKVLATHLPAAPGSPIRYPQLEADENMQIRAAN